MAFGSFDRVFHYHLKKCSGTTLNAWLALQVSDETRWDGDRLKDFSEVLLGEKDASNYRALIGAFSSRATEAFYWTDAVYTHLPLGPFAPPNTFSFTVLRRPTDRIVSQIADWRRLDISDYPTLKPEAAAGMRDAQTMTARDFLEKHARTTFLFLFDNYMTRALAAARLGFGVIGQTDLSCLELVAQLALAKDFNFVGIVEDFETTQATVAERLGLPAPPYFPKLNETRSKTLLEDEAADAADVLGSLTRYDEKIYASAVTLCESQIDRDTGAERTARFEALHAADTVRNLHGRWWRDQTVFSVRDRIVGWGYHPRDAAGTANCRVWSGPGNTTVIYMPVPVGTAILIKVWVHGYAAESQRASLHVDVNDRPAAHRFEPEAGWREAIVVHARSKTPWVKLTLTINEALDTIEAGFGPGDNRKRGISFDQYGWQAV